VYTVALQLFCESEWNWMTFNLVQTKNTQQVILFSNDKVSYHSNDLENVGEHGNL
jgi:hypothetical protein